MSVKREGGDDMRRADSTTLEYVTSSSLTTRHITLIDPAKQDPNTAANRAMVAVECGSSMIFVGGSTDTPDEIVHATCRAIQRRSNCGLLLQARTQNQKKSNGISP